MGIYKGKVEELMHRFLRGLYGGGLDSVLDLLYTDIVWIRDDYEFFIIGAERVCRMTQMEENECGLMGEEYIVVYEGNENCIIAGKILIGSNSCGQDSEGLLYHVTAFWTGLNQKPLLRHIHLSRIGNRFLLPEVFSKKHKMVFQYEVKDRENNTYCLRDVDILYIESQKNYLIWHCRKYNLTIRGTMSYYQERMSPSFIRIHKSYLVNISYVVKINRCFLKMKNGDEIQIPVKKYRQVKERILERPDLVEKVW